MGTLRATRRSILRLGATATLLPSLVKRTLAAEAWPRRPVKLIVGFPPGSSPDFLARLLAEPLAQALGQPVIVDNKPGAAGVMGVKAVASAADGHTIGLTGNGPLTTAKLLNPRLSYDVARDLRPISLVASSPFVLVGRSGMPVDLPGLMAYAKSQGSRLSYGSVGVGSGSHLGMELLKKLTGIQPVHVPFQGFPQVMTAMVSGEVDLALMIPSVAMTQVNTGRLRMYAVSTASRAAALPELPSISQALRIPFDVPSWNAVFGPASMPAVHAERLSSEITRIVRSDEVRHRLFEQSWQALGTAPEGLVRKIAEDTALWAEIIRLTGARSEV